MFLNDARSYRLMETIDHLFYRQVQVPRMKVGQKQTLETLINEEALLLAKYLRDERKTWIPRIHQL